MINPRYSLVIPAYNEEAVIEETYFRLTRVMQALNESYELIFVNDGSRDQTEALLGALESSDPNVRLLSFSRNFGHQTAVTAGLDHARGQAIIIIDADLQDPPELIPQMIEKWKEGYAVVYGQRRERRGESWFKKLSAALFYRFLNALTEVNIPLDTGDFRLIDRRVADILLTLREKNRFIRGLVSWVGFRQTALEYVREERRAGKTKYSLKKNAAPVDGRPYFLFPQAAAVRHRERPLDSRAELSIPAGIRGPPDLVSRRHRLLVAPYSPVAAG
jgi:Glycosyltransferases involved in cell wall biogenesis